jgi:hypothetical protein
MVSRALYLLVSDLLSISNVCELHRCFRDYVVQSDDAGIADVVDATMTVAQVKISSVTLIGLKHLYVACKVIACYIQVFVKYWLIFLMYLPYMTEIW